MDILLATLFVIVCVLLVIVVLLQKGRGGGLSAALGGMGSHSAFGSRTGDVFTWVTIILVAVFILLAVVATRHFRPSGEEQVETPMLMPLPRALERTMTVTITVPNGGGEEKVFYTLDGTEPSSRSLVYDAPVRVSPGQTVKAIAYRRGWRASRVVTGDYPVAGATTASGPASAPASMPAESQPALAH